MKHFFLEEKKGAMLPRVAPSLSDKTFWLYKGAYLTDQQWSIRAAGVRQLHIDQAQSLNLYITNEFHHAPGAESLPAGMGVWSENSLLRP